MLRSGSVMLTDELRSDCVRLVDPAMFRPMLGKVCEKLTELARVLCV